MVILLLLAAVALSVEASSESPAPPVWPNQFETTYTLELPYVAVVQSTGLKASDFSQRPRAMHDSASDLSHILSHRFQSTYSTMAPITDFALTLMLALIPRWWFQMDPAPAHSLTTRSLASRHPLAGKLTTLSVPPSLPVALIQREATTPSLISPLGNSRAVRSCLEALMLTSGSLTTHRRRDQTHTPSIQQSRMGGH